MAQAQTFQNHGRIVPLFHGVAFPILIINFFWSIYRAFTRPSWDTAIASLVAAALVLMFFFTRLRADRAGPRDQAGDAAADA